jgi:DNA helicase HerA-like ATPase
MATAPTNDEQSAAHAVGRQLERFRALRRELEASVLPLASSVDGRRFTFQRSLHGLDVRLGGYVVLEDEGTQRLGQLLSLELGTQGGAAEIELGADEGTALGGRSGVTIRHAHGEGAVLEGDGAPFHDAMMRPATVEEVRAWGERTARRTARLEIGELALAPGAPCMLDAGGFDRHTFLCGQSGSGKTYSLGVVLERLLMETELRIVILDPNSDFARLSVIRDGADPAAAERYRPAAEAVSVHSSGAADGQRLRLRIAELEPAAQAALLRLDPIADREEHSELAAALAEGRRPTTEALIAEGRPEARALAMRVRSLGVESYGLWARDQAGSVLDAVGDPAARCVVVDLGSLPTREEEALTAAAVLGELWRRRTERRPVLIVIDEAHNVCPAEPEDGLTALATRHAVRIAAEGRKFGLYLLVSTQRPQKVHENVISQCDNLMLMRLNSTADAAFAQAVFSFVPPGLVAQSATFRLGEALVAGKISPHPALVRFGARVAEEGGSDVPTTWAMPR